jgi:hypothetical protein
VAVTRATDLTYREAQGGGGGGGAAAGNAPVQPGGPGGVDASPTPDTTIRLNDVMVARIKALPHVVNLTPTTMVGAFQSVMYQGQQLAINTMIAYDPNGTIRHDLAAGRELQESDGAGIVTLTADYADKLGFKQNYGGLVGQKITLRTQPGFSGEGATLPPEPTCSGGPGQGPPQPAPGQGQPPAQGQAPGQGPGGGGCGPGPPQNSQPTDLPATVVGVIASTQSGPTIYFPLSWAHGLLENRHWGQSALDQKRFNQAQQAYQEAQRTCFSPGHPQPCSLPPQPQQHFSLVTLNSVDQDGYGSIIVQADSATTADGVAAAIKTFGVGAASAQAFIKQQEGVFNLLALILGGIGAIALAVAAIGVINTMVMAILERTREIGVLRACGATRAMVRRLFTFEAALLGFWGGVFGVILGFVLTLVANPIVNNQLKVNSVSGTNIITIPPWLIIGVVLATTLIGILAGLYPAGRAARLNPVDALRYE